MESAAGVGPDEPDEPLEANGGDTVKDLHQSEREKWVRRGLKRDSRPVPHQTLPVTLTTALRCSRFAGLD